MWICGGFARRWTPWRRWPWAYIAVVREEAAEKALSPARIREQEAEGETAQEMQEALDLVAEERQPKAG